MNISEIYSIIDNAFREDIGDGDHSALSCIPSSAVGVAHLLVKDTGILAGVELAKIIAHRYDSEIQFRTFLQDGDPVQHGEIAFELEGKEQHLLTIERLILNFMQRMSGIATHTNKYVQSVKNYNCKILDTRKTTPGVRLMEKWAVRIGGGHNHRFGLYDMIMLKDNHVDFCGSISNAIARANEYIKSKNLQVPIEIEVRNLNEVAQVLKVGNVQRIMFDNFTPEIMKEAVKMVQNQYETEASGGINLQTVEKYAESGVDFISVGALTHQIHSLDLSLKAKK